jgi:hypothetical protein
MADPDHPLRQILEELGEAAVRVKNTQYEWGGPGTSGYAVVSEWLRDLEAAREEAKISEAIALARRANTIAVIATIIAIVSAISSIIIAVVK